MCTILWENFSMRVIAAKDISRLHEDALTFDLCVSDRQCILVVGYVTSSIRTPLYTLQHGNHMSTIIEDNSVSATNVRLRPNKIKNVSFIIKL